MTLLFAFLIGVFAGLRSLTPPAAVAWAVYLGWLTLPRPLSFIGALPAVIILTLLAISELILDKLPKTPNRTAPPGLIARIMTGGFTGACVSLRGGQSAFVGAALGLIGGIVGCFGGYHARAWLVRSLRLPDFSVAFARGLGCDWWQAVHRFAILMRRLCLTFRSWRSEDSIKLSTSINISLLRSEDEYDLSRKISSVEVRRGNPEGTL